MINTKNLETPYSKFIQSVVLKYDGIYRFFLMILLLGKPFSGFCQTIEVNIHNIMNNNGSIIIELYDNKKDFLRDPVERKVINASENGVNVKFDNVSEGQYAIGVMHDVNDNNKLDSNFIGIPREPIAVSNNLPPRFGRPKFKHARFEVNHGKVVQNIVFKVNIN